MGRRFHNGRRIPSTINTRVNASRYGPLNVK